MNLSSVIVLQIDVDGVAFDPTECNTPVSAGADRIAGDYGDSAFNWTEGPFLGVRPLISSAHLIQLSGLSP
jgi:hypothetical protein